MQPDGDATDARLGRRRGGPRVQLQSLAPRRLHASGLMTYDLQVTYAWSAARLMRAIAMTSLEGSAGGSVTLVHPSSGSPFECLMPTAPRVGGIRFARSR